MAGRCANIPGPAPGNEVLMQRRSYGTGSLISRNGRWYGQWRSGGQLIKRAIGPKRQPGSREGLTRKQAEAELRRLMQTTRPAPRTDAITFEDAAREYLRFVGDVRKIDSKTLADYRGVIDGYLLKEFGPLSLEAVTPDLIDAYKERLIRGGQALGPHYRPPPNRSARDLQAGQAGLGALRQPGLGRPGRAPQGGLFGRVRHLRPRRDRAPGRRCRGRPGRGDLPGRGVHRPTPR